MVQQHAIYQGTLRCQATHDPSGVQLITDAPTDNHGLGRSFSPTDLVATALGTCVVTTMAIVAQRHQLELSGTKLVITKEMVTQPVRRIGKLTVHIDVPLDPGSDLRERLEKAAHACPVHQSLHPDVVCDIQIRWGVAG
jgi:putative redox protein